MTSALERGIEAAKSGLMEESLAHLKDAIVEEPENANVWVWLSAIIEDEEKQTVFLKKALDIDPGNRPAQRGLAFIERKKYIPPKPGEKLSDYTRPIGVFGKPALTPSQAAANIAAQNPLQEAAPAPQLATAAPTVPAQTTPKPAAARKPWLDILLYGFTLMIFIIIGILIGSTLLNIDIPFLSPPNPVLSVLPPANGVFILENDQYSEMPMNQTLPADAKSLPETASKKPEIVINTLVINLDERLELLDQDDQSVPFEAIAAENNTRVLTPVSELTPGRYCLVYSLNPTKDENLYWCLYVDEE
ncbi:MAG: hypothetical protein M0P11_06100 [Anaerolineaceae bacterium]|nr:hypothetical protein [Anaerolineaceae bacterium]